MAEMLVGKFPELSKEYVSESIVLCTRMGIHEGVPITVSKAKVPFLNVDLYKGFLANFHE